MTWRDKIIKALNNLGGEALLSEIYDEVASQTGETITVPFKASIRDALERNSSDSEKYNNKYDIFYCVKGKGNGKWGLRNYEVVEDNMDITQDDSEFSEGRQLLKKHLCRERNHFLIKKAKDKFKQEHEGRIFCEVCGFDFFSKYGKIGENFIEAHHTKAVSEMKENEKTRIEDIAMVCSNCHSMLHRSKPWLDKQQLMRVLTYQQRIQE